MVSTPSDVKRVLKKRSEMHLLRKCWHIFWGMLALFLLSYSTDSLSLKQFSYLALFISALGFAVDFLRLNNKKINDFFLKIMWRLMRNSEENGFSGLPFYALGVGLTLLFFERDVAIISILFLVIADPMASFVGVLWGRDKILPHKTLQGIITCFFVCFFILSFYLFKMSGDLMPHLLFIFLGALLGTISEMLSAFNIDDNFTIPVVSGAGLTLLNNYLNVF